MADDAIKTPQMTAATSGSSTRRDERTVRQKLADWYLVYELRTALYSLEPWEKAMFNSFLVAFMTMGCYTAYCFLPRYAERFVDYLDLI